MERDSAFHLEVSEIVFAHPRLQIPLILPVDFTTNPFFSRFSI